MLTEAENGLVAAVRAAAVGQRLRAVESLPDLDGKSLVQKIAADAPAVYVSLASFRVANRVARLKFGLACVARNSRGHLAARQGDGRAIGLYEMLEAVMTLADGLVTGDIAWQVTGADLLADESLYQAGLYAAVVQIESPGVELPPALDEASLDDFTTFGAQWDLPPFDSAAEHDKWLQAPPDTSTSAPDLSETQTL